MSYLSDKESCVGCGQLYDRDLLNKEGKCKDCVFFDEEQQWSEED